MTPMTDIGYERLDLHVDGVGLEIATARRGGERAPIVFLHGFGSTKEDYVDLAYHPGFGERPFLAYARPAAASSCEDPVQALDPVPRGRRQGGPARSGDRALPPRGPFHGRPHRAHARPPGPGSRPELRRQRGQRRPRGNASSADRSSRTRHTTPRASSTPSSNGRAIRRSSPVRSTRRASGTRSAPAPYAASSSPSSTSPTTAT